MLKINNSSPETTGYPDDENPLLEELSDYLETSGISDPFSKIYVTHAPIENLDCLVFLFVISQIGKFSYSEHLGIELKVMNNC